MRNRGGGNGAYQFGQPGIVHVQPYAWMYMYMYVHTTHVFGSNSFGVAVCYMQHGRRSKAKCQ